MKTQIWVPSIKKYMITVSGFGHIYIYIILYIYIYMHVLAASSQVHLWYEFKSVNNIINATDSSQHIQNM